MADKSTIDSYDKIAQDFHARNHKTIYGEEYRFFKDALGNGKRILEIGCGTGRDARELIEQGFDYTGIDASEGMLAIARENAKGGSFKKGDFYALDFPTGSFDGFWAAASFLHAPKADMGKALSEARRILRDGGIGFISLKQRTHMDEGVIRESKAGGIERYFSFWDAEEFAAELEKNGFKVLKATKRYEGGPDDTTWLCFIVKKS